ncbi:MAG: asparaginase [Armatimonadetes bacterium]|nr:asparaginase [Armatimonadota bacterium]
MPDANLADLALLAEVTRGPLVESRHFGRVVAVDLAGRAALALGDTGRPILPRSAIKPLQALPTVALALERGLSLTDPEIAVMCASHAAEPFHLEAVRAVLARAGATEADLHCGPHAPAHAAAAAALIAAGESPRPIHNNCSGKHAGMLLMARLLDAPLADYWQPDHPVQRRIQDVLIRLAALHGPPTWGTDGCAVPTYALPLVGMARAFAQLTHPAGLPPAERAAAEAIRAAMNACPEHVSGTGTFHAALLRAGRGRYLAKGGAEGCYALGVVDPPLGLALKIEDGAARAIPPVLLAALDRLGILTTAETEALHLWRVADVLNTRGDRVGVIRAVLG